MRSKPFQLFLLWVLTIFICLINLYSFMYSQEIVYTADIEGTLDIWVVSSDGNGARNLSIVSHDIDGLFREATPRWSPDGKKIAYSSNKSGWSNIWIMDDDGTNDYNLTNSQYYESSPFWSPDGSKIYFRRDLGNPSGDVCAGWEIFEYDLLSGEEYRLTFNSKREDTPLVSPDGYYLIWTKNEESAGGCFVTDIWKMNADGSNQHYIFGNVWAYEWAFDWGEINNKILINFTSESGHRDIAVIDPEGTNFTRLTNTRKIEHIPWAFSPDNLQILYTSNQGGYNLWIMNIDGSNPIQITNEVGINFTAGADWRIPFHTVAIDIKPGSYPNSINLGSNGNVPVVIFSKPEFDATTVDPLTVTLAGASVRIKGKGTPQAYAEDVDGDGLLDLIVHVDTTTLQLSSGDTEAILEGKTYDGVSIRGVDTVRIVQE